jgi:hypothetical protein
MLPPKCLTRNHSVWLETWKERHGFGLAWLVNSAFTGPLGAVDTLKLWLFKIEGIYEEKFYGYSKLNRKIARFHSACVGVHVTRTFRRARKSIRIRKQEVPLDACSSWAHARATAGQPNQTKPTVFYPNQHHLQVVTPFYKKGDFVRTYKINK